MTISSSSKSDAGGGDILWINFAWPCCENRNIQVQHTSVQADFGGWLEIWYITLPIWKLGLTREKSLNYVVCHVAIIARDGCRLTFHSSPLLLPPCRPFQSMLTSLLLCYVCIVISPLHWLFHWSTWIHGNISLQSVGVCILAPVTTALYSNRHSGTSLSFQNCWSTLISVQTKITKPKMPRTFLCLQRIADDASHTVSCKLLYCIYTGTRSVGTVPNRSRTVLWNCSGPCSHHCLGRSLWKHEKGIVWWTHETSRDPFRHLLHLGHPFHHPFHHGDERSTTIVICYALAASRQQQMRHPRHT